MKFLTGLFVFALAVPATAQWQRLVLSGKGPSADVPAAHSLKYFTANPFLRDDASDFCTVCTPAGKAESARQFTIRTEVRRLGVLAGFPVLDVLYHVGTRVDDEPPAVRWKSILVQVGPDRFKEIFHLQAFYTTVSLGHSRIVQSGNERVLATMDSDGGNGGFCWEGYWWFDAAGPHPLDFSGLERAMKEKVPAETLFDTSCSYLSLETQTVRSAVQKRSAQCHACDYVGEVTARFQLNGAVAHPIEIEFKGWETR